MIGMEKLRPTGPQKPTMAERIADVLPGPYFVKCLILWMVLGTPGLLATRYLDTLNVDKTLALFAHFTLQDVVVFSLANLVMPFYALYGTRYIRLKIVKAIPELEPATEGGTRTLNEVFSSISDILPAFVLAVFFGVLSIVSLPGQTQHVVGYLSFVVKVVGFALAMLSYGTFIWMYMSSVRGLNRLGKAQLRLISFYEDSHLGMKPVGSVSLSFAWAYFLGIGLVFFSINPVPIPILLALLGLILIGVIFFFLPLQTVHMKMVREKQNAEKALRKRLNQVLETTGNREGSPNEITEMVMLQMVEQKISKISEWPFDAVTLSWFSAIVITILGTIATRYLLIFLGL